MENEGIREEIKNKENDDRNDGVWGRCNFETFEAGGGEIEKNEFGDEMKSWNGDGLALRLDKLENGIKVKREEGERKKRGGE